MSALWQLLRGWFARVGSDPYYASYERSLGNIKAELDRLQASRAARARAWAAVRARFWGSFASAYAALLAYAAYVNRQPAGAYTTQQHAARVAPVFVAPLVAWLAHRALARLQALLDRRGAARARQLEAKLRKQVAELKDSTRYDRTLLLLQKFDPDYAPPKPPRTPSTRGMAAGGLGGKQQAGAAAAAAGLPSRAAGAAVNAAGSALQGAGARMLPALAQLYSRAAGTLIADDPVMLSLLREAQQQSDVLRQRLYEAEHRAVALLQANIALKQQLGLPTDEEQAALAAWMGAGSADGSGGGAEGGAEGGAMPAGEAGGDAADTAPPALPPDEAAEEHLAAGSDDEDAATATGAAAAGSASRVSRRKRGSRS